jgi:hypothetical protein
VDVLNIRPEELRSGHYLRTRRGEWYIVEAPPRSCGMTGAVDVPVTAAATGELTTLLVFIDSFEHYTVTTTRPNALDSATLRRKARAAQEKADLLAAKATRLLRLADQ